MRYHKQQLSTTQAPLVYVQHSFTDMMRNAIKGFIICAMQTAECKCRNPVCIEHTYPSFVIHHFHSPCLQNNTSKHIVGLQFVLKNQCMDLTFNTQNMHCQAKLYNLKELMNVFLLIVFFFILIVFSVPSYASHPISLHRNFNLWPT